MPKSIMQEFIESSHLSGGNAAYIEDLYDAYLHDPNSVADQWRNFFDTLPQPNGKIGPDTSHATVMAHFEQLGRRRSRPVVIAGSGGENIEHERKQVKVAQLIISHRNRGHQKAKLDPLGLWSRDRAPDLELSYHGLTSADLDTTFQSGMLYFGPEESTLKDIIAGLEETYCGHVGVECGHVIDLSEKRWLQQRFESARSKPSYDNEMRKYVLQRLTAAEGLEKHLDSKYPGTKRFGLEGGESMIPMLDGIIQRAGEYGAKEVVLTMAHRGRLNVLVNVLGKNPSELFAEFEGKRHVDTSGDVKYHQGFSSDVVTPGGKVHLALMFNPSHLEIAAPVAEGSARARQDRREDTKGEAVFPIVIHGDAAFAGQGVVMETFQMSQLRGYKTGGTVHVVINNQVGFTTSVQEDARSTEYCTDIAKMVQAPIIHVNADDPDAVMFVTNLAMDYRYQFKKDIVIDLICYRRRGHNETDEPSATQPLMYKVIKNLKTTRAIYSDQLVKEGVVAQEEADAMLKDYREKLDRGENVVNSLVSEPNEELFVDWNPYLNQDWDTEVDTTRPMKKIRDLAKIITKIPDGVVMQRQVGKIYEDREKMARGALSLNWGMAELLAYATLLDEGYPIRMTGQDTGRGTFSHRHAVIHNQKDGSNYIPLKEISKKSTDFEIYDSFLSEEAVLGFEYGYASTSPKGLVIWEAQFGDFANGAQVVIDQFITSGEHKWGRMCGLIMLLPHGYEGQGPEHSSARLERFLQLSAEHNIQVCIPTTPAQVYHMIRRQAIRPMRRPLVVMSPKWILRHKLATSSIEDLSKGKFMNLIQDQEADKDKIDRLILCSGKVYYHLYEARQEKKIANVALVRIEQLYPFPDNDLMEALQEYKKLKDIVWCQEEPINQGAWYSSQHHMHNIVSKFNKNLTLSYVGREASAAPACGYMSLHLEEQKKFINEALVYKS
jgi:2-oxoglutarate dehydrogenase E1 component